MEQVLQYFLCKAFILKSCNLAEKMLLQAQTAVCQSKSRSEIGISDDVKQAATLSSVQGEAAAD